MDEYNKYCDSRDERLTTAFQYTKLRGILKLASLLSTRNIGSCFNGFVCFFVVCICFADLSVQRKTANAMEDGLAKPRVYRGCRSLPIESTGGL